MKARTSRTQAAGGAPSPSPGQERAHGLMSEAECGSAPRYFSATIPGDPVPWRAPNTTRTGHSYPNKRQERWREGAVLLLRSAWGGRAPMEGPLRLSLLSIKRRPRELSRAKDPAGRIWCPTTPDLTNVQKHVEDALQEAGVIRNDKEVCNVAAFSLYGGKGEEPSVEVIVEPLAPLETA